MRYIFGIIVFIVMVFVTQFHENQQYAAQQTAALLVNIKIVLYFIAAILIGLIWAVCEGLEKLQPREKPAESKPKWAPTGELTSEQKEEAKDDQKIGVAIFAVAFLLICVVVFFSAK